jgi:hypothetical protein
MSNFPLYTSISTGIPSKDLTVTQKKDFVKKVDAMQVDGHELIYALIKTYYIDSEQDSPFTIPYGGKFVRNDMTFNLDDVPIKLRQILYKFAKIHSKKMKEDKSLEKGRTPKK